MALLTVPQSSISGEPGATFNSAGAAGLASAQGDQSRELGQTLQGAGQQVAKIVTDMQLEANQLRVDDAINRLKEEQLRLTFDPETGFSTQRGVAALERESGQSLADEYTGKLDTTASDLSASLGNVSQREAFARAAQGLRTQFYGQLTEHETREFTAYSISVRDGTVGLRLQEMGTRWNDPNFDRAEAELSIRAAVADKGRILGWSAKEVELRSLALVSSGHKTAILAALEEGNVAFADAYLARYGKPESMTGDDMLAVRGQITKEMDATVALTAVEDAYGAVQPALDPSGISRAVGITRSTESNNQPGIAGPPTPRGTAYGTMQVLDTTGAAVAKKLGIPWRPDLMRGTSAEAAAYQDRIGTAYFTEQVQAFSGDLRKAWAAYNAGPRWVKDAQARAAVAAPGTPQADWFWQLNNDGRTAANRKQTQDYVDKNWAAYSSGAGAPRRPTLDDILGDLRKDPRLAASPARLRLAEQEATRRWTVANAEREQRSDEAREAALRYLDTTPRASMATLPPSMRSALDPDDYDTVNAYASLRASGKAIVTDESLYVSLTVPGVLGRMSDANFYALRPKLSDTDFESFARQRSAQQQSALSPPETLNNELTNKLAVTGMALPAKPKPEDKARVAGLTRLARESILREQTALGRQLTPEELRKHLDRLFASTITYSTTSGKTVAVNAVSAEFGDIPPNTAKLIRKKMEERTGRDVSDQEVLEAWRMAKLRGQ